MPGKEVKAILYSIMSVGLELMLVSWQSARRRCSHKFGDRLPLLFARLAVIFPASERPFLDRYQIILLGDRGMCVRTTCPELLPVSALGWSRTGDIRFSSSTCYTTKPVFFLRHCIAHTTHLPSAILSQSTVDGGCRC